MERPRPKAFVKVGSLLALLKRLGGKVRPGRGWSVSELGGDQWLSRGPRYFFAGQARRAENGVTMEPFWVSAFGETGSKLKPLQGAVSVPMPGVIFAKVTWEIEFGPDPVLSDILIETARIQTVEVLGAATVPTTRAGAVDYTVTIGPPDVVNIISSQPQAVAVVVLATLDANGVVTHLAPQGGVFATVGEAVITVVRPTTEFYYEGVRI